MDISIFTSADLEEISARGMTPGKVLDQIDKFKKGMPFTKIVKPCTVNDGITVLDDIEIDQYINVFTDAQDKGRCMKFVPASGAASRMFKFLLGVCNELEESGVSQVKSLEDSFEKLLSFIDELDKYAFYDGLKHKMKDAGEDFEDCRKNGRIKTILTTSGL